MGFKLWIEDQETKKTASRDIILNFLKDRMDTHDDESVLQMTAQDIDAKDPNAIQDLLSRGAVTTTDQGIISRLRKGEIDIKTLIDLLAAEKTGSMMPSPLRAPAPDAARNTRPTSTVGDVGMPQTS